MPEKRVQNHKRAVTVVTPTLTRASEVAGLLENLCLQSLLPEEIILVDGAPSSDRETLDLVTKMSSSLPFAVRYVRHEKGTAIQRNRGIEEATRGEFVAFIDDDVRLEPDFLETILTVFESDTEKKVGGVVGHRTNVSFAQQAHQRWRWYQRLKFFSTYEPGRYDYNSGYPINGNSLAPFHGVRQVDFMTTACAVWRHEVFESGLRFDPFFEDYGVLEDTHFSLRAGRRWQLLQCGDARCQERHSPEGRVDRKKIGYKCVVNYYYVFQDIVQPLTWRHHLRFWRFQVFELLRLAASAVRRRRTSDWLEVRGRLAGFAAVMRGDCSPRRNKFAT
jgi:glycosyltransferase involved in cell wall biosynthesis